MIYSSELSETDSSFSGVSCSEADVPGAIQSDTSNFSFLLTSVVHRRSVVVTPRLRETAHLLRRPRSWAALNIAIIPLLRPPTCARPDYIPPVWPHLDKVKIMLAISATYPLASTQCQSRSTHPTIKLTCGARDATLQEYCKSIREVRRGVKPNCLIWSWSHPRQARGHARANRADEVNNMLVV